MPKRARVHFVSLRSSLVNLPISIYGPLVERSVVCIALDLFCAYSSLTDCRSYPCSCRCVAPSTPRCAPHAYYQPCGEGARGARGGVRWMDGHGVRVVVGALQCRAVRGRRVRDYRDRPAVRTGARAEPGRHCAWNILCRWAYAQADYLPVRNRWKLACCTTCRGRNP